MASNTLDQANGDLGPRVRFIGGIATTDTPAHVSQTAVSEMVRGPRSRSTKRVPCAVHQIDPIAQTRDSFKRKTCAVTNTAQGTSCSTSEPTYGGNTDQGVSLYGLALIWGPVPGMHTCRGVFHTPRTLPNGVVS